MASCCTDERCLRGVLNQAQRLSSNWMANSICTLNLGCGLKHRTTTQTQVILEPLPPTCGVIKSTLQERETWGK